MQNTVARTNDNFFNMRSLLLHLVIIYIFVLCPDGLFVIFGMLSLYFVFLTVSNAKVTSTTIAYYYGFGGGFCLDAKAAYAYDILYLYKADRTSKGA